MPEDGRGEHDADWGRREHFHQSESGEIHKSIKKWFGCTVHLIADTTYELPVAFTVTRASRNEKPVVRQLLRILSHYAPEVLEKCEVFTADRGYDDGKLLEQL